MRRNAIWLALLLVGLVGLTAAASVPGEYDITVQVAESPHGGGEVTPEGTRSYDSGVQREVEATPNPGYTFWYWKLSWEGQTPSYTILNEWKANHTFYTDNLWERATDKDYDGEDNHLILTAYFLPPQVKLEVEGPTNVDFLLPGVKYANPGDYVWAEFDITLTNPYSEERKDDDLEDVYYVIKIFDSGDIEVDYANVELVLDDLGLSSPESNKFDLPVGDTRTDTLRLRFDEDYAGYSEHTVKVELHHDNASQMKNDADDDIEDSATIDLYNRPDIDEPAGGFTLERAGDTQTFSLTADNPSDGADYDDVLWRMTIAHDDGVNLDPSMFRVQQKSSWSTLAIDEDNGTLIVTGKPFELGEGQDKTIEFRIRAHLNAPLGEYSVDLELIGLNLGTDWLLQDEHEAFGFDVAEMVSERKQSFGKGWHLISVPCVPEDNAPEQVFSSVLSTQPLILYFWDVGTGNYVVPDEINPGHGYWLYISSPAEIELDGCVSVEDEVAVELGAAGWHLVSTPKWDISLNRISFEWDDDEKGYHDALDSGWLGSPFYWYDLVAENYYSVGYGLKPWQGYWVHTTRPLTMIIDLSEFDPPAKPNATSLAVSDPVGLTPPPPPSLPQTGMITVTNYPNPVTGGRTTFVVQGVSVESMRVVVRDISGRALWQDEAASNSLAWNATDSAGRPVANGVYLYEVKALLDGSWVPAGSGRLLIVR